MSKVKWSGGKALLPENKNSFINFCDEVRDFNLSDILLKILYNRGIDTYDKVEKHLYMELSDTHNPSLLKDSDKFVEGMKKAIDENHKIVIMGDYDADGVNATAIAMLALRNLNLNVDFYINNRFVEGYGMTPLSLENILKAHPDVKTIITVDNGIVAFEAVQQAVDLGIQVLLTDHHEPREDEVYPNAYAVVDPKREDCKYPFSDICGAGVIFKLMLLLYWELGLELDYVYELLDLLAVATVADVMSLTEENRVFVKEGLNLIRSEQRLFFKILNEKMSITTIDEETIGFKYGPAINAIGRLDGCPSIVVEAMISDDIGFVTEICERMVKTNERRKELSAEHEKRAEEILSEQEERDVIVIYDEDFEEGLVGIVAGRVCEKYYKPTVVLTKHGDKLKGSARSIEGFDVKKSFDYCSEFLLGYGGHPPAGGLSLMESNLEDFISKINEYGKEHLTEDVLKKVIEFDGVLTVSDINGNTIDDIARLKPYGQCFKQPLFGFKMDVAQNGFNENVAGDTLILTDINKMRVVGFRNKQQYIELGRPEKIAMLGCPIINVYNGNVSYQFRIHEQNLKAYKNQ